jgi:mevalonate kinase
MARRIISLDEKIEKAEAEVIAAKAKYDRSLDELERLVTKRKQLNDKRILEAYHASGRTVDEIIEFLQSKHEEI